MSRFIADKLYFYFRKSKKKQTKESKWSLLVPNLRLGLGSIELHDLRYSGKPIVESVLNRRNSISKFNARRLLKRLEVYKKTNFYGAITIQGKLLYKIISIFRGVKYSQKFRKIFNLFILDFTLSYKGWRHFKGLPVRGQRSRNNANITKVNSIDMTKLKDKLFKSNYKNLAGDYLKTISLVEVYNKLWFNQWNDEWSENRERRFKLLSSVNKVCVYDFVSASAGRIAGFYKKPKAGKKKKIVKDNYFTIGLDPDEIKLLIKTSLKRQLGSVFSLPDGSIVQVLLSNIREKKKVTKKLSTVKKKQDKLAKLKKKKEVAKNKFAELRRIKDQKTKNLKKAQK